MRRPLRSQTCTTISNASDSGVNFWRGPPGEARREALTPPLAIDEAIFRELDGMARSFVAEWIWFASAPETEIAIERERYARSGFAIAEANVRYVRLHRLRADVGEGRPLVHSTLDGEDEWVKDLVTACWVKQR